MPAAECSLPAPQGPSSVPLADSVAQLQLGRERGAAAPCPQSAGATRLLSFPGRGGVLAEVRHPGGHREEAPRVDGVEGLGVVSGGAAGRGAGLQAAGAAALLHQPERRRRWREERGQRETAERLRGLAVVAPAAQAAARPLLVRRVHGVVVGAAGAGAAAAAVTALVAAQAPQIEEPAAPQAPAAGGGGQGRCQGSLGARRRHGAQGHRQGQGAVRRVAEVEAGVLQGGLQAAGRAAAPAVQRRVALGGLGSGARKHSSQEGDGQETLPYWFWGYLGVWK